MERRDVFEKGEFYHIYNRGVNKYKIFFSKGDWDHFQRLLFIRNSKSNKKVHLERETKTSVYKMDQGTPGPLVDIVAYTFMENHFHLLIKEREECGISKFMSRLMTSYAMYMNKKYDRSGPLMCRPFRSKHINSDEYLRWIISYIHLNPIDQIESNWKDNGISDIKIAQDFLNSYKYSSYMDYMYSHKSSDDIGRVESVIINKNVIPIDISDVDNLKGMLREYLFQEYLDDYKDLE